MGPLLFISYSRADIYETNWMDRLKMYLAPYRRSGQVDVWEDSRIEAGANWRQEIDEALDQAQAAILLVGPGFLASEFVMEQEVPALLAKVEAGGLKLFPLITGFCGYNATPLEPYQAFNSPDKPLESLATAGQNKVLNELAKAVDQALRQTAGPAAGDQKALQARRAAVAGIARILDSTGIAFDTQADRRDALAETIERRLGIRSPLEYEKFFFKYYPQLTREELFEFDQIRAITEGPLHDGNRKILSLLEEQPGLLEEIPELEDLKQHLVFWLNKYDRVFARNKAMCVLYTGVEDAIPFPSEVVVVIDEWLEQA